MIAALVRSVLGQASATSIPSRLRRRRFERFERLVLDRPDLRILDVGGTPKYWRRMGYRGRVLCVNLEGYDPDPDGRIACEKGDARDLSRFRDGEFDVAWSNSVLEHVGGWEDQARAAAEIRRVGRRYCVQVPNRTFPIEPHYLFPGVQFLPESGRRFVALHWPWSWARLGGYDDRRTVDDLLRVRLVDEAEMRRLFPDARIWKERVMGLTKSFTAIRV